MYIHINSDNLLVIRVNYYFQVDLISGGGVQLELFFSFSQILKFYKYSEDTKFCKNVIISNFQFWPNF